ncbi:1345_t:CDS:1 [Funneliformis geosporum]|uniref:10346_t:CDS:1 n=1 Tax=Funneliformis geosporum TaxID=1117311 RepID=A0A9W4SN53_9GLOM|nr:10346_t:CDS:1 [Funneliformis geosporum]CAI2178139.1 1345_t:CDS:1 [Funneliformis geosporum]
MVQKKEPKPEQNIYSPYYYPNFSRYNFPSKIGGDEEQYTEPKFSFPHWDDEVQAYKPPRRRRASSPLTCTTEDIEYFNNKANLANDTTAAPSDVEDDVSETVCEDIQKDIDLARKDQKTDYDQFRKTYATFHDDIRALQREIEAIEASCLKNGLDLKGDGPTINDDGSEICYNPTESDTCNFTGSSITYEIQGCGRLSSATAAATTRGSIPRKRSSPSILYKDKVAKQQEEQQNRENISGNFNDNNSNNRRCLGIEDGWTQERVHQNEWIRC